MLTSDFYEIFLQHPYINKYYAGTYAANNIPSRLKVSNFLILNTSETIGQHWYTVYRPNRDTLECFDSLGIDSPKKQFIKNNFAKFKAKELLFNTSRVQSLQSTSCGQFVLYFLFQRLHNQDLDFTELLDEIFELSDLTNEQKVKNFIDAIVLKKRNNEF